MTVSAEGMQARYELFNSGDIGAIVAGFAPNGVYEIHECEVVAIGHAEIRVAMSHWRRCFESPRIDGVRAVERPSMIDEQPGAAQCFTVEFTGDGRYIKTMPGPIGFPEAHDRYVSMKIGETVWLDRNGLVIRAICSIQTAALR